MELKELGEEKFKHLESQEVLTNNDHGPETNHIESIELIESNRERHDASNLIEKWKGQTSIGKGVLSKVSSSQSFKSGSMLTQTQTQMQEINDKVQKQIAHFDSFRQYNNNSSQHMADDDEEFQNIEN